MRNTTSENRDEIMALVRQCESTTRAMEILELQGQFELCRGTELPTNGSGDLVYLHMGIEFGPVNENDPLFCTATLPDGWSIRPTDDRLWSELVDEDGMVWARIFYRASPHDRHAYIMPDPVIHEEFLAERQGEC